MGSHTRIRLYPEIIQKQGGEFCVGCGLTPEQTNEKKLLINHVDNNNSNNMIENLQFLCRTCNRIKNPSRTYKPAAIKTQGEITNLRVEENWRAWVMDKVLKNSGYFVDEIIYSGAELFACSPETISRRYLPKLTSALGLFIIRDGVLYLKSHEEGSASIAASIV